MLRLNFQVIMVKVKTNFHIALPKARTTLKEGGYTVVQICIKCTFHFAIFFQCVFHLLFFLCLSTLFVSFTHPADGSTMDNQELLLSST